MEDKEKTAEEIPEEIYQLEEYFRYLEKLSREDLLTLLKWEVTNRVIYFGIKK